MKVGFLSPTLYFIPYGWGSLRAYLYSFNRNYQNLKFQEPVTTFFPQPTDFVELADCDLLLTSHYVWNHNTILKSLKYLRQLNPKLKVIAGGPNIKFADPTLLEEGLTDFHVFGEGEKSLSALLDMLFVDSPDFSQIRNIGYRDSSGMAKFNQRLNDFIELNFSSPYVLGVFDEYIEKQQREGAKIVAPWETNRGCPFSCTFCDWGSATMSKIRSFSEERLMAEIQYFADKKLCEIYICDSNFGMLNRDVSIAKELAQAKVKYGYPSQIRASNAKNASGKVLAGSKFLSDQGMLLHGTSISLQTSDPNALEKVKRRNIKTSDFEQLTQDFKKQKVHFFTELIFPLPGETLETFYDGFNRLLIGGNHDDIRVYELSLLPNAQIDSQRTEFKFKTIHRPLLDFAVENTTEIVIETKDVSVSDWLTGFKFAELVICLQNGAYLKYLTQYLYRELQIDYKEFYLKLIAFGENRPQLLLNRLLSEIEDILQNYLHHPQVPQWAKIRYYSEAKPLLEKYGQGHWFVWQYIWIRISENLDLFYDEIYEFLLSNPWKIDHEVMRDLITFQKAIVLTPDYDPEVGTSIKLNYDWRTYFIDNKALGPLEHTLKFNYRGFGSGHSMRPRPNDLKQFAECAVGYTNPDTKSGHFTHDLASSEVAHSQLNPRG